MSQHAIKGTPELAKAIKERRLELHLTIEEAANKSGVGIKTWCRYEAGESIRLDKAKGLCKALNWRTLPDESETQFNVEEYKRSQLWSKYLEENFGETAAISFVVGSEILEDFINSDLTELAKMPRGSHIGEVSISFLANDLPAQFLTRYDYDFYYALKCALHRLTAVLQKTDQIIANSVLEELVVYLIVEQSRMIIEDGDFIPEDRWDKWIFEIFDDEDIITFLYSDIYVPIDHIYHFDHWMDHSFYTDR